MKTRTRQITRLFGVAMLALALAAGLAPAVTPAIAQQDEAAGEAQAPAAEGEETAETAEGATTENAAEPDAPAIAASEEPAVEHNPYGLKALWDEGDFVSKGTLLVLVIMSMGSWYILFTKLFEQRRMFDQFNRVIKLFAPTDTLKEGIDALPARNSYRVIAEDGKEAVEQFSKGLSSEVTLTEWSTAALSRSVDGLASKLQGGLAFLATVGSTAPFVGLFGTVWGIYHALVAIGVSGQASIDKVAGPVGEALIMTAIGLAVAVPAVLGYNLLIRRNKAVIERARRFATEVHLRILSGRTA